MCSIALCLPGTIIIFDEYIGYEDWQDHEYKAFREAAASFGWSFDYLAFSLVTKQTVVHITAVSSK